MTTILLIVLWQGVVSISKLPVYILPSPYQVISVLYQQVNLIAWHGFLTFSQIIAGLFIATIIGIFIAFLLDCYKEIQEFIQPFLVIMQATPSFILMPLLMIWCGFGLLPKMIVVCLSAFFPITLCLLNSLKRTPLEWLELAKVMKGTPFQIMRSIRWPAALPGLFSGLRLAAIHAPLTVLAADWNGASEGLGYLIMLCHGRLQIDLMFACLFCTVLLTLLLNLLVQFLEAKFVFWPAPC
jgi:putative hydroxymethylpyrimidine transport system permease protein